jgi:hypothetical protein
VGTFSICCFLFHNSDIAEDLILVFYKFTVCVCEILQYTFWMQFEHVPTFINYMYTIELLDLGVIDSFSKFQLLYGIAVL